MPTSIFPLETSTGTLTINGISLHTYAWCAMDLRALYTPAAYRAGNVTIPAANGNRAYRYWIAEATHDIQMRITGLVDQSGTPNANPFLGYQTNLTYLKTNLLTPPAAGTFAATISLPSGSTISANVQVLGLQFQQFDLDAQFFQKAALTVRIPAGLFS